MSRLSYSLKIALIYALLGCAWIIFSDKLVLVIFGGLSNNLLTQVQNLKGAFFVLSTATLLYFMVRVHSNKQRESDKRYKQFFYQNPSPMWVYDPVTLGFVDVNEAALNHYGFTREEFIRMTIKDIRPASEVDRLEVYIKERGFSFKNAGIWQHKKKDGTLFFVNVFSNDILIHERSMRLICAIDVNKTIEYEHQIREINQSLELRIEERTKDLAALNEELQSYNEEMTAANDTIIQQAETIKQQSETRLNIILESITDGFFVLDEETCITKSNSVFLNLFGLEGIPIAGNHVSQLFDPSRQSLLIKRLIDSLARQESALFDIFLEGSNKWIEVRTYPNKEGLFVYLLDVTEFKNQQEVLLFNQQNLDALINNTDDLIWSIDRQLKLVSMNDSFIKVTRLFSGQTIQVGQSDIDLIEDATMRAEWLAYYHRALKGERFSMEQTWTQNPHVHIYDISFNPITNHQQEVVGVGCFAREITQRKQAEMEKGKLVDRLTKQNRDLEEFAFITSHNLRAPVASILGLTHIFNQERIDDPLNVDLINHLQTSAEKLDHVIADLSAILEMKSNIEDTLELVSLPQVIDDIKVMLQEQIQNGHAEIACDFGNLDRFRTNKAYINNILFNLVSNALKYKRRNEVARIRIQSFVNENEVGFSVQDNGKGIDLAQFGHQIFTLYKRFHLDVEGKGVGLYLVKNQVEALGGRVIVESKENEGALFTVLLPKENENLNKNDRVIS